jgi:glycosyltransferase involved in cell wall biosynthesis
MAKITVLIPHFGCEQHLHKAAASILAQTETDLELRVIDDCSDDEAWLAALAPLMGDPRLKLFRTSRRAGPYRIKNVMIERCDSAFVAFQDADDASFRSRFEVQLACMARHQAGMVGSSAAIMDDDGRYRGLRLMPPSANLFLRHGRSYASLHPTTLVRREVFGDIGAFDGTTTIGADSDFLFRAAYRFKIRNALRPLYWYRQRTGSLTNASATGHGSQLRTDYWNRVKAREAGRKTAQRDGGAIDLGAPLNDLAFQIDALN